jgi:hypothetical protein
LFLEHLAEKLVVEKWEGRECREDRSGLTDPASTPLKKQLLMHSGDKEKKGLTVAASPPSAWALATALPASTPLKNNLWYSEEETKRRGSQWQRPRHLPEP